MDLIIDFLSRIINWIFLTLGSIWFFWILAGVVIIPLLWIYYLFKTRKNKDEFLKVLTPGILCIAICFIYYCTNSITN